GSQDGGSNWVSYVPRWTSGPADFTSIDSDPGGILFAVRLELHSYRHAPGDTQWAEGGFVGNTSMPGGGARGVGWISGTGASAEVCGVLHDQSRDLRYSSNGGGSWSFPGGPISGGAGNHRVDVLGNNSAIVLQDTGGVRVSNDLTNISNVTWNSLPSLPATSGNWTDLFARGQAAFAVDNVGRVARLDAGSWAILGGAIPGITDVVSLVVAPFNDVSSPSSYVSPGSDGWLGWKNSNFSVRLNASDDQSVDSVSLFTRRSLDGSQWTPWKFYDEYPTGGRNVSRLADFAPYGALGGQGLWQFAARANDSAGNVEPKDVTNLTVGEARAGVDTGAPSSDVAPLPQFSKPKFRVSWRSDDLVSKVERIVLFVKEDEGIWTVWRTAKNDSGADYTGTPGHRYSFYSQAWDYAGNVESAPVVADAWTMVDDSPPITSFASFPAQPDGRGGWFITSPMLWLNSSEAGNTSSRWGATGNEVAYTGPFNAIDGTNTLQYWSRDIAGNVESAKNVDLKVDIGGPGASVDSPPGLVNTRTLTLKVTAADTGASGIALVTLQYRTKGSLNWTVADSGNASGDFMVTFPTDGSNEVRAVAEDSAGNAEAGDSAEAIIVVDTTPPSVSSSNPADDAKGLDLRPSFDIVFSEDMDSASLAGAFRIATADGDATLDVSPTGNRTVKVKVVSQLPEGTSLTLVVSTSARDLAGNGLVKEHVLRFSTKGGGLGSGGGLPLLLALVALALIVSGLAIALVLRRRRRGASPATDFFPKDGQAKEATPASEPPKEEESVKDVAAGPATMAAGVTAVGQGVPRKKRPLMRLEGGYNFLILSSQPREAFEAFADLVNGGSKGMVLTTTKPEKALREHGIDADGVEKIWLTDSKAPGAANPKRIEFELTRDTMAFLKKNPKGVLMMEGVEYLIAEASFEKASRYVKKLADQASSTGATLIVTVNPGDVKDQLGVLRKGFDKVLFEGGTEG
ncbi:MAG TPA: Ig-like domain-containing protein, partial [Thermoplasmata archaeon]|nr:Ig-like domain-containing protein [Thermoplasmata archaeon]